MSGEIQKEPSPLLGKEDGLWVVRGDLEKSSIEGDLNFCTDE